jgi:hypothetical protein
MNWLRARWALFLIPVLILVSIHFASSCDSIALSTADVKKIVSACKNNIRVLQINLLNHQSWAKRRTTFCAFILNLMAPLVKCQKMGQMQMGLYCKSIAASSDVHKVFLNW